MEKQIDEGGKRGRIIGANGGRRESDVQTRMEGGQGASGGGTCRQEGESGGGGKQGTRGEAVTINDYGGGGEMIEEKA